MAGIEKVCEFCGEYVGSDMYGYKHNLIQVLPKYRKEFRYTEATLIVFKPERYVQDKRYGWARSYYDESDNWEFNDGSKFTEKDWIDKLLETNRFANHYDYTLKVPSIQGEVFGEYAHHTYDLSTVKRKMKRLLRCKKLTVKHLDCSIYDYYEENENEI